jgi:tetratricopeptide (TPR) repeat protein
MNSRICLPVFGILLLSSCTPHSSTPDGAVIFDAGVALTRGASLDSAQRDITVDEDSIIVALVDEQLTDVTVRLALATSDKDPAIPVETENHLRGAGIEVAALEVRRGARLQIFLSGPPDASTPGKVRLRVLRFDADGNAPNTRAQLAGLKAWSIATNANYRGDSIKKAALADMDRAIESLSSAAGDPALAAEARLVKANMYQYFQVDWDKAHKEAQLAARSFAGLAKPDKINEQRANYIEAQALVEISADRAAVNPTAEEAGMLARTILLALSAPTSGFSTLERARAIATLGYLDINNGKPDDAQRRFEAAASIYREAGNSAGEREMAANLAAVLLERGQFKDAALAYDGVLPEAGKISNPDQRAGLFLNAARAQLFSGRTDEGAENLLKALALARKYKLRSQESRALQGLGQLYLNRADLVQARTYFTEGLKIDRAEQRGIELVWSLASAGVVARADGDFTHAIELHKEAVSLATNPVGRVRTMRELGLDYYSAQDYPAAIAQYRGALAVNLQNPKHHAYSDVKRNLAQVLVEHGDSSPATYLEIAQLLDESLASCLKAGDKLGEIGAHRIRALLLAKQGKYAQAKAEYEQTFTLAYDYRDKSASAEARAATLAHEQNAFRGYLDLMLRDVAARGVGKPRRASMQEEGALRKLELARDANFGAVRTGELDGATSARVDALLTQMAQMSLKIAGMIHAGTGNTEGAELEKLQLDMSNLRVELDGVRTAAAAKRVASEKTKPRAVRDWRKIDPGVVQLSFALGNEHAYAWARSESGIVVSALAQTPKDLEQELIELGALDRQAEPGKVEQALERVSSVLMPEGLLPAKSTAVQIVAEGRIAGVPFPGLRSPSDANRRLVETHAITMISSMFSVEEPPRPRQARPFRLVALASGSGTLRSAAAADPIPILQAATKEISIVAMLFTAQDPAARIKLLTGAAGSAAALRNIWASGADVVHFATHAMADLRQPLASLLVLPATGADGASTYLTAGQVEGWRGDTDLVFLSACESAVGPPRFAGGMPGLQRAFLRAGARGVIATLWPIEDLLAQQFSADFYRRFTRGENAAQALSETQREWLAPKPGASELEQQRRRITALAHGSYTQ